MRRARRTRNGRWYVVDEGDALCQLGTPDWTQDSAGHWPRVDLEVRSLGSEVRCPRCGAAWVVEEMDCVFGVSRPATNDLLVIVRCASCRLPHRVRCVGFVTAYPRLLRLMDGWVSRGRRARAFATEEQRIYGTTEP